MALRPDNYSSQPANVAYYPKYHWKLITLTVLGALSVATVAVVVGLTPVYIGRTSQPTGIYAIVTATPTNQDRISVRTNDDDTVANRTRIVSSFKSSLNAYEATVNYTGTNELTSNITWLTLRNYQDIERSYYSQIYSLINSEIKIDDGIEIKTYESGSDQIRQSCVRQSNGSVTCLNFDSDAVVAILEAQIKNSVNASNTTTTKVKTDLESLYKGAPYNASQAVVSISGDTVLTAVISWANSITPATLKQNSFGVLNGTRSILEANKYNLSSYTYNVTNSSKQVLWCEYINGRDVCTILPNTTTISGSTQITINNLAIATPIATEGRNANLSTISDDIKAAINKLSGVEVLSAQWGTEVIPRLRVIYTANGFLSEAQIKTSVAQVTASAKSVLQNTTVYTVSVTEPKDQIGSVIATAVDGDQTTFNLIGDQAIQIKPITTIFINNLAIATKVSQGGRNANLSTLLDDIKAAINKLSGVRVRGGDWNSETNPLLSVVYTVNDDLTAAKIEESVAQVTASTKSVLQNTTEYTVSVTEVKEQTGGAIVIDNDDKETTFLLSGGQAIQRPFTKITIDNLAVATPIATGGKNDNLNSLIANITAAINKITGVRVSSAQWGTETNPLLKVVYTANDELTAAKIEESVAQVTASTKSVMKDTAEYKVSVTEVKDQTGGAVTIDEDEKETTFSLSGGQATQTRSVATITISNLAIATKIDTNGGTNAKLSTLLDDIKVAINQLSGVRVSSAQWSSEAKPSLSVVYTASGVLTAAKIEESVAQVTASTKTVLKDTAEYKVSLTEAKDQTGGATVIDDDDKETTFLLSGGQAIQRPFTKITINNLAIATKIDNNGGTNSKLSNLVNDITAAINKITGVRVSSAQWGTETNPILSVVYTTNGVLTAAKIEESVAQVTAEAKRVLKDTTEYKVKVTEVKEQTGVAITTTTTNLIEATFSLVFARAVQRPFTKITIENFAITSAAAKKSSITEKNDALNEIKGKIITSVNKAGFLVLEEASAWSTEAEPVLKLVYTDKSVLTEAQIKEKIGEVTEAAKDDFTNTSEFTVSPTPSNQQNGDAEAISEIGTVSLFVISNGEAAPKPAKLFF